MLATFYYNAKRRNSTKIPVGGVSKTIHLKDSCSTTAPTIVLQWDGSTSPTALNYVHIPSFDRYYWINAWNYENRQWTASCVVDVLATYKSEIGSSSKYVLRAASDYDPNVMDSDYPTMMPQAQNVTFPDFVNWATDFSGGSFVVGIVGRQNSYSVGGAAYYVMSAAQIQDLIDAAFTETDTLWSTPVPAALDIGEALNKYGEKFAKSIQNPAQFINSIVWLPFTPSTGASVTIKLGNFTTGVSALQLASPQYARQFTFSGLVPSAIDGTYGKWRQVEPFVRYQMVFPPFGSFDLDAATVLLKYGQMQGSIIVDCITGQAILNAYDFGINAAAQLGIPITIAGNNVDYAGAMQTTINSAGSTVGRFLKGDIAGAVTGGLSGVIDVARASQPYATQGSVGGGMAALNAPRYVLCTYYQAVPEDNQEKGRPLCQIRTISSLSGYVLCADGEVEAAATSSELAELEKHLTGGFFYE